MEAKLTLKLDKTIIETAKRYAEKNDCNLSKLVESFLKSLASPDTLSKKYSPLVESLTGIISEDEAKKWADEDPRIRNLLAKEQ
ncbi:MAG: DUF6364 family protein [Planctomycetaceae bacterium]|jgi:hypothetical protein|nr:DUF6364 family protein [Planctomycetaceae bacterium]